MFRTWVTCPICFCLGFGHAGLGIPAAERAHVQPWPVSLRAIGVSVRETPRAERALRCVVASPAPLLSWPRSPSALLTAFPTTPVCCIWFRRWQVYELQGSTRCSDALHCRHRLAFLLIRSHHILQLGHFLLLVRWDFAVRVLSDLALLLQCLQFVLPRLLYQPRHHFHLGMPQCR